ncbi:MAG TPA: radical SAM protein [Candidatus Omnitrophota bacterium]|nr:radical SAM protein [Candidatus Omnitrophota bacterium]
MKIALINPPYLVIYKKLNIHQEASIPLGLLYIAAVLEKAGYQVKVFDPNLHNLSLSELIGQIRLYEPELIGLTSVTPTFNAAQKISFELKRAFPGTPIVMGGPHVTSLPENSLNFTPEVDFVIAGEGELTIIELVKALEEKKADFSAINGVGYRNNGKIILNPSRPVIEELDSLPYPAYHLLPIREYAPSVVYRIRGKSTFIMSSRGCPAFCTFCANTVTGRKLRVHSLDYFLGLLHHIIDVYGIRHFTIVDDNFIADPDRAREICKRIIKERLNITWFIFARTDHCQDLELLKIMRRAGCVYVQLGIESGNEEVLRQLGKNVSKEACVKAGMNCRQAGIDCMNSFMIGNPKDTKETVLETINFAIKLDSTMAGFNILIPYPGTAIFKKYYQEDFGHNNEWEKWNHITHDVPIDYRHTTLTKRDLDSLRKLAICRYYLRPRQLFRILILFRSFPLFLKFIKSSWEHLLFLFSRQDAE